VDAVTRSSLIPFLLAAIITGLIGTAVAMTPYFAGDVALTKAVQSISPNPPTWATQVSRLAPAPGKYFVMAIVLTAALFVGGWRGLVLLGAFLLLEQYGAEYTKAIFKRPRPSPELVTVFGKPSGFSFPSTTLTFFAVTFGGLGVVALVRRQAPMRLLVMAISFAMVIIGCLARIALGFHWPSDVFLTSLICMLWIWAAARGVLGKA
jgi:membrane-associated phospholipid phosphatase